MDMWNWLLDCYKDGSLTLEELEAVMTDDFQACLLWDQWAEDCEQFIPFVRDEVEPFIKYIKKDIAYKKRHKETT